MTVASDLPVLAIDIGGTKIAIDDVSDAGSPTGAKAPTPRTGRGDHLVAEIAELAPKDGFGAVATTDFEETLKGTRLPSVSQTLGQLNCGSWRHT